MPACLRQPLAGFTQERRQSGGFTITQQLQMPDMQVLFISVTEADQVNGLGIIAEAIRRQ
jgi:hypothetical protein